MKVQREIFLTLRLTPDDAERVVEELDEVAEYVEEIPEALSKIKHEC